MNDSAAKAHPTGNMYEAHYKPVWAASWRAVKSRGRTVQFETALAAEVAAWRFLYSIERKVMRRDGEIVFAARSAADKLFKERASA